MPNFWKIVNSVIVKADIVILVLDARFVAETRNPELEEKIENAGKEIIFVLNKSDLVDKDYLDSIKGDFENCVFMSAKEHMGTNLLRKEILRISRGEKAVVGVLGYPNTGKSSVINALSGGGKANVSPVSGYTRAMQLLRASTKIYLIDTPGVIPFMEKDEVKHLLISSMNPNNAKDPDIAAEKIVDRMRDKVEGVYGMEVNEQDDSYDLLIKLADKLNYKKKGGDPDIRRVSVKIINDWQKGKIK